MQFLVFVLSILLSAVTNKPEQVLRQLYLPGFPALVSPPRLVPTHTREDTEIYAHPNAYRLRLHILQIPLRAAVKQAFSPPCNFMAVDFTGFMLAFVWMYAVEAVEGAEMVMTVPRLVGGLLLAGLASTMASYFEGKQRLKGKAMSECARRRVRHEN
ncbi:hypothetical protein C8R45DRAFT_1109566 [Mycena sanguinolenta]|nr:hypothetical protein C8R45DRAFT_1109566 [Mycena sanguinolenta]